MNRTDRRKQVHEQAELLKAGRHVATIIHKPDGKYAFAIHGVEEGPHHPGIAGALCHDLLGHFVEAYKRIMADPDGKPIPPMVAEKILYAELWKAFDSAKEQRLQEMEHLAELTTPPNA